MASELPLGWRRSTVADGLETIIDYRGKTPPKSADGIPLISAANVKHGRIDLTKASYISPETYESWTTRGFTRPGDVLITTEAPAGEVAPYPTTGTFQISRRVMALRADGTTLQSGFLAYALQSRPVQAALLARNRGTTVPRVLKPDITGLELLLPPLEEQCRIAAVLGALDDKIELNRKMNRTLEELAQAIFKSWFIDFDGVAESELVESELGPIPKGWEVASVADIVQFNPRTKLAKGTVAKFVEMKVVPTDGPSIRNFSTRAMKHGGSKFVQGDTLMARITPCLENGKTALVDFLDAGEVAFGSTEFIVMRPKGAVQREWIYCLARSEAFRNHAVANMTGSSGRQRVSVESLSFFRMARPAAEQLDAFTATTRPLFERVTANAKESQTLANLRDTLLPKLISGEIRVPEAEKAVEAAT